MKQYCIMKCPISFEFMQININSVELFVRVANHRRTTMTSANSLLKIYASILLSSLSSPFTPNINYTILHGTWLYVLERDGLFQRIILRVDRSNRQMWFIVGFDTHTKMLRFPSSNSCEWVWVRSGSEWNSMHQTYTHHTNSIRRTDQHKMRYFMGHFTQ